MRYWIGFVLFLRALRAPALLGDLRCKVAGTPPVDGGCGLSLSPMG